MSFLKMSYRKIWIRVNIIILIVSAMYSLSVVGYCALSKDTSLIELDPKYIIIIFVFIISSIGNILLAVIDIKDDLITRQIPSSDASMMGKYYFGNSIFWGILWVVIAVIMAFLFLRISSRNVREE